MVSLSKHVKNYLLKIIKLKSPFDRLRANGGVNRDSLDNFLKPEGLRNRKFRHILAATNPMQTLSHVNAAWLQVKKRPRLKGNKIGVETASLA